MTLQLHHRPQWIFNFYTYGIYNSLCCNLQLICCNFYVNLRIILGESVNGFFLNTVYETSPIHVDREWITLWVWQWPWSKVTVGGSKQVQFKMSFEWWSRLLPLEVQPPRARGAAMLKALSLSTFAAAGPRLWNSLPWPLRQSETLITFKRQLKTFLFVD